MASVTIAGVTYPDIPHIEIPKSTGGGNLSFYDVSSADTVAGDVRAGKKFFGSTGSDVGTLAEVSVASTVITSKSQKISIPAGIHAGNQQIGLSDADIANITSANIRAGVNILGIDGGLSAASITQDSSTKVLYIS